LELVNGESNNSKEDEEDLNEDKDIQTSID